MARQLSRRRPSDPRGLAAAARLPERASSVDARLGDGRQVRDVEGDIAGHEEIEPAVAVVVAKGAAGRPAVDSNARRLGATSAKRPPPDCDTAG